MNRLVTTMALICAMLFICPNTAARIVHEERSLYRNILVDKDGPTICLKFSVRKNQRNQSCMNRRDPRRMLFSYTRMTMAALLLNPDPQRILVVGLGGGTLPTAFRELFPSAEIVAVEIDPAVVRVAEAYFGFRKDPLMKVVEEDARVYTKRAVHRGVTFDLIVLDAFNGDYIPEHLMTTEYLQETQQLMAPGGVLVANTFSISRLYDHESVTYQRVFGEFINFALPESANRVVIAAENLPEPAELRERAKAWRQRLKPYAVPITRYPRHMTTNVDWDTRARPLTDDYSPANLLNQ